MGLGDVDGDIKSDNLLFSVRQGSANRLCSTLHFEAIPRTALSYVSLLFLPFSVQGV